MTVPGLDPDSLTALAERLALLAEHATAKGRTETAAIAREASVALPALQRALDAAEAKQGIDQSAAIFYRDKFRAAEAEVAALRAQLADIEALRALSEAATTALPLAHAPWDPSMLLPADWAEDAAPIETRSTFSSIHCDNAVTAAFVAAAWNYVRAALSVPAVPVDEEARDA